MRILKMAAIGGVLLAASATSALAAEAFVGNTIVAVIPSMGEVAYAMSPDGTFKASNGMSGKWTYTGGTLCFDTGKPEQFCGPFDGTKGPGSAWEDKAWDGNGMAKLSVKAGL